MKLPRLNNNSKNDYSPVIPIILSLVCAFVLWMYVMSVESPTYTETFKNVGVSLQNESIIAKNGLSVVSGTGYHVDVTVTGRKSIISRLDSDDIKAYVDLSGISSSGEYLLEIKTELDSGVSLYRLSQSTITVYVDMTTSKTVPIDPNITYYGGVTAGEGYSMGKPYIMATADMQDTASVVVNGPVSILNTIVKAKVRPIEIGAITASVPFTSPLVLYDESGNEVNSSYITIVTPDVRVYFPVVTERELEIKPNFTGSFDTSAYSYSVSPSSVKVRAEEKVFEKMTAITFDVSKSDTALVGETKYELVPDGVEIADGTTEVTLKVEKKTAANTK